MRSHCRVIMALFVTAAGSTSIAAPAELAPRWTVAAPFDIDSPPIVDGSTIVVRSTSGGITALDAESGATRWQAADLANPVTAGPVVYADRVSSPGMTDRSTLVALDVRDGRERWSRPGAGGILAADDSGVVTGHGNGIARYASDGTKRWAFSDPGGFPRRIITNDRYVIDLTAHSGARIAFDIQTIERGTGEPIGSAGFTDLLGLDAETALGTSDEIGEDPSLQCGFADLVTVSLGAVVPASPDRAPSLEQRVTDYVLDDLAEPTAPPPGTISTDSAPPRRDDRDGPPRVVLAGRHVVLASGSVLGVFDLVGPRRFEPTATPFARYRDATFVGGPFAGRIYVARPGGLDAMTIGDRHRPRFDRLVADHAKTFAIAGLGDRLYVSAGTTTTAFDANTIAKRTSYRLACERLRAIVRTDRSDVLACDRGGGRGLIAALPRSSSQ